MKLDLQIFSVRDFTIGLRETYAQYGYLAIGITELAKFNNININYSISNSDASYLIEENKNVLGLFGVVPDSIEILGFKSGKWRVRIIFDYEGQDKSVSQYISIAQAITLHIQYGIRLCCDLQIIKEFGFFSEGNRERVPPEQVDLLRYSLPSKFIDESKAVVEQNPFSPKGKKGGIVTTARRGYVVSDTEPSEEEKLELIKRELELAVEHEDYVKAAQLRDKIQEIEDSKKAAHEPKQEKNL